MNWQHRAETICAICRRVVDRQIEERARLAWQPLIICDACVREADRRWSVSHLAVATPA